MSLSTARSQPIGTSDWRRTVLARRRTVPALSPLLPDLAQVIEGRPRAEAVEYRVEQCAARLGATPP